MILVDTNILVRLCRKMDPLYGPARNALRTFHRQQEVLCITQQNFVEFWVVATRPQSVNGLGMTTAASSQWLAHYENFFRVLDDPRATHARWKQLIQTHKTIGKPAHDARLAAIMQLCAIDKILTFNVNDFHRYGITAIDPRQMPAI